MVWQTKYRPIDGPVFPAFLWEIISRGGLALPYVYVVARKIALRKIIETRQEHSDLWYSPKLPD